MKDYLKTMRPQGTQQQMQETPPTDDQQNRKDYPKSFREKDRQIKKGMRVEGRKDRDEARRERNGNGNLDSNEGIIYAIAKEYNLPEDTDAVNARLAEIPPFFSDTKATPEQKELRQDINQLSFHLKRDDNKRPAGGHFSEGTFNGSDNHISTGEIAGLKMTLSENAAGIERYEKRLAKIKKLNDKQQENEIKPNPALKNDKIPCADHSVHIPSPEPTAQKLDPSILSAFSGMSGGSSVSVLAVTGSNAPAPPAPAAPAPAQAAAPTGQSR